MVSDNTSKNEHPLSFRMCSRNIQKIEAVENLKYI